AGAARVEEAAGPAGNTKPCPPRHPRDVEAQTSFVIAPPEEQGGNGAERSLNRVRRSPRPPGPNAKLSSRRAGGALSPEGAGRAPVCSSDGILMKALICDDGEGTQPPPLALPRTGGPHALLPAP